MLWHCFYPISYSHSVLPQVNQQLCTTYCSNVSKKVDISIFYKRGFLPCTFIASEVFIPSVSHFSSHAVQRDSEEQGRMWGCGWQLLFSVFLESKNM